MSTVCPRCDQQHCYLDAEMIARHLGISLEDIPLAQQAGTLGPADAHTAHGRPLWRMSGFTGGVS